MTANKIPLIYIAGPFAAPTNYELQQNVARVEALGLQVAKLGALPVMPHCMNRNFFGQLTEDFWLAGVMELLDRCDALVLTPGWQRSKGAVQENSRALDRGMPWLVYEDVGQQLREDRLAKFVEYVIKHSARSQV